MKQDATLIVVGIIVLLFIYFRWSSRPRSNGPSERYIKYMQQLGSQFRPSTKRADEQRSHLVMPTANRAAVSADVRPVMADEVVDQSAGARTSTPVASSAKVSNGIAKGFGIAALVFAIIAIPIPFGIVVSAVAIILATIAALAGDRIFATATALIAAVNALFLSPSTWILMGGNDESARSFITAVIVVGGLLPFGAMVLNATGNLVLGRR